MSPALSPPAVVVRHKGLLTVVVMAAMILQILDMTVVNVALPHMQTSLGAAQDTITWALTSYIVALAIATPITGWLSDRIGRKQLFLVCIAGFVGSSALCGMSFSLEEMVFFRVAQGAFGAALAPLSQSVMLDINPRERQGQAMALWGAGIMVAPILGPTIGAWITDNLTWRWCFYVNVPIGIAAFFGVLALMPDTVRRIRHFDLAGFLLLSVAIGVVQIVFDRGQQLDWFESTEVLLETGIVIAAAWMFVVHSATAKEPFLHPALFRDRNYVAALVFIFLIGTVLLATMALLPPMLQGLFGYPVVTTGLILAPRGIGTMVSMMLVGRVVGRFDPRILMTIGLGLSAYSLWQMTAFSPEMTATPIVVSGLIQGLGLGFVFIPMTTVAFSTLDPSLRTDASSLFNLVRNLGSSIGISVMAAMLAINIQVNHAELVAHISPFSQNLGAFGIDAATLASPSGLTTAMQLDGLVNRQAAMIAYIDDFMMMFWVTLAALPLIAFLRVNRHGRPAGGPPAAAMAD